MVYCISKPAGKDAGPCWGSVPGETVQDSSSDKHQPRIQSGAFSCEFKQKKEELPPRKVFISRCSGIPVDLFIPWSFLPHQGFALLHPCNSEDGLQVPDVLEGGSGANSCHGKAQTKAACGEVSCPSLDQYGPVISALLPRVLPCWNERFPEDIVTSHILRKLPVQAVALCKPYLGHHLAMIRVYSSIFCWLQHWV